MSVLASLSLALGGCETTLDHRVAMTGGETSYASFFPYYAELCALSQIRKKPGFGPEIAGGPGGHAVLYLNGACRVGDAPYPTLALCGSAPDAEGDGAGISVNAHYRNANWIATPGRDFFFRGTLAPGEGLTRAAYEATQARAKALGILKGVAFHQSVFDDMPAGQSRRDFMYEESIGTDYAVGFARDRYCSRLPLTRAQMAAAVRYLNRINRVYETGRKVYDWNVLEDNCSHLTHNALAAAGVWDIWPTDRFVLIAALSFPVPKNEFVNLVERSNDMDIGDIEALFHDPDARRTLMRDGWLPTEPGALVELVPAVRPNAVYDTDLSLIFYDDPVFGSYQRDFDRILREKRYSALGANLAHFRTLYRRIAAARRPLAAWFDGPDAIDPAERPAFAAFYRRYYAYIDRMGETVSRDMAGLETADIAAR